jgi:hypothetical protein
MHCVHLSTRAILSAIVTALCIIPCMLLVPLRAFRNTCQKSITCKSNTTFSVAKDPGNTLNTKCKWAPFRMILPPGPSHWLDCIALYRTLIKRAWLNACHKSIKLLGMPPKSIQPPSGITESVYVNLQTIALIDVNYFCWNRCWFSFLTPWIEQERKKEFTITPDLFAKIDPHQQACIPKHLSRVVYAGCTQPQFGISLQLLYGTL